MVKKILTIFLFTLLFLSLSSSSSVSQSNNIIDSFGDHKLSGWYWGGNLVMKYSHQTDNLENGYSEVMSSLSNITPNSFVGLIRKDQKIQLVQDNILSLMLQGTNSDLNVTVQILYDKNSDGRFDENTDARLESKPVLLNFSGWKEIHININENEFKVVSKDKEDDFSIIEGQAIGIQLTYQTGKDYKSNKIQTGVALITERFNKEIKQDIGKNDDNEESYFKLKNYPNPFNAETNISYVLKNSSHVKITVYDRLGREVAVLVDGSQTEGEHTVSFNASNLPSGIYFYRLKTSEKIEVKKMVLAK